jgi:hypothetical protein
MRRLLLPAALLATALALLPAQASAAPPPVKHVWLLMLENQDYDASFGADGGSPYLAQELPRQGELLTQYFATTHESLGNYIALVSGQASNPETQSDCQIYREFTPGTIGADGQALGTGCVFPAGVKSIADQLDAKGLGWKGYMEDMPAPCSHPALNSRDSTQSATKDSQYATRHNPFMYFHSVIDSPSCAQNDVPLDRLTTDLQSSASSPALGFITPDLCSDGHDKPCADGRPGGLDSVDVFLREWVPRITGSPAYKDGGMLIVTFDEAAKDASACCNQPQGPNTPNNGGPTPGRGGGRIGAVVLSQFVKPGTANATPYNHFALLRSVEDLYGLDHLGFAARDDLKPFGDDVYSNPSGVALPAPRAPHARFGGVPKRCVSGRFKVRYSVGTRAIGRVDVSVDGHRVKRLTKRRASVTIDARKLKRGRHTLKATVVAKSGLAGSRSATFKRC